MQAVGKSGCFLCRPTFTWGTRRDRSRMEERGAAVYADAPHRSRKFGLGSIYSDQGPGRSSLR